MLLARTQDQLGQGGPWSFPAERLPAGARPQAVVEGLSRRLLGDQAVPTLTLADTVTGGGSQRSTLALVYVAELARPTALAQPKDQVLLWWSLGEMRSLTLAPLVRRLLIDRWATITTGRSGSR